MRTLKVRTPAGAEITVDCDLLVPFLKDVKNANAGNWNSNGQAFRAAVALNLIQLHSDGGLSLRPQAADFLATVAVYPFEPAPEPEQPKCTECGGKGTKPLFVSEFECGHCKGKGIEPKSAAKRYEFYNDIEIRFHNEPYGYSLRPAGMPMRRVSAYFNEDGTPRLGTMVTYGIRDANMLGQAIVKTGTDFERMTARLLSYDPPLINSTNSHSPIDAPMTGEARPWLPIDSEYAANLFVGQRVEIDAPGTDRYGEHSLHGQTAELLSAASLNGLMFEHSSVISWMGRDNVRLRPATDTVQG